MTPVTVVLTSSADRLPAAVLSARAAAAAGVQHVVVLDLDGSAAAAPASVWSSRHLPQPQVVAPEDVGIPRGALHVAAVVHGVAAVHRWALATLVEHRRHLASADAADAAGAPPTLVLAVTAGTVLLADPGRLVAAAAGTTGPVTTAVSRPASLRLGRADATSWPGTGDLESTTVHDPALVLWGAGADVEVPSWTNGTVAPGDRWLDVALEHVGHTDVAGPAVLLSPWSLDGAVTVTIDDDGVLAADGATVLAVDLSAFDPARPWLLAAHPPRAVRASLSDHAVLSQWCHERADELMEIRARLAETPAERSEADSTPAERPGAIRLDTAAWGEPVDDVLRGVYLDAIRAGSDPRTLPDPLDPAARTPLESWLTAPGADGAPGRYLLRLRAERPDLMAVFPGVPGEHTSDLLTWAMDHGRYEGRYPAALLERCVAATPVPAAPTGHAPTAGLTVVGYLGSGLGLGESARLMVSAAAAAGIPHGTVAVASSGGSAQNVAYEAAAGHGPFDTHLLCVNADHTAGLVAAAPRLLSTGSRVGMWYWEVESFPERFRPAFDLVDEVWVATDFIREAIAPHTSIPVRTVTPPLPQARTTTLLDRSAAGLPGGELFSFAFDFLSTMERKNPLGLVDAFTSAFSPDDGAVLLIKSINANLRPVEAEQLRHRVARLPHVRWVDGFWEADRRDALMAHSTAYVSLHRAEGLGLTVAEAMAWGTPVVTTAYSGTTQFASERNSFGVPWRPVPIPAGAEPYPAGTPWADPDLDAAAALLRRVVDDPHEAQRRAAQAATDIATLHSPAVAGAALAEAITQLRHRRRHEGSSDRRTLRQVAGRALHGLTGR